MANRWRKSENSDILYFLGLQNHCRWWLQSWIKRDLLLGRKPVTNLDSILKSRDIILPTKVCIVKVIGFPVVMYGCENWTMEKAEHWRTDAFESWFWRRLLTVPWTPRRSNQSILKEINPEYSLEGLMLKLKFQNFGHLMRRADSLEKILVLGKIWGQEEKKVTKDEVVGWHHWLNGHEFEQASGDGEGQGSLACCSHGVAKSQTWLSDWTTTTQSVTSVVGSEARQVLWY